MTNETDSSGFEPNTPDSVVCVVGPGRSGTSVVARLVGLLGYSLGTDERLMGPGRGNARGFWENLDLTLFNESMLNRHGCTWNRPPTREVLQQEPAPELLREAQALLSATFGSSKRWAWKDPRNSLTVPFWRRLIPNMSFVICVRNPLDVAASLSAHGYDFSFAEAADWWLRYQVDAIVYASGSPHIYLDYETSRRDPGRQIERIASFLDVRDPAMLAQAKAGATEFVDRSLSHHETELRDVLTAELRPEVQVLYSALWMMLNVPGTVDEESVGVLARNLFSQPS